jgi:hypothetical protein
MFCRNFNSLSELVLDALDACFIQRLKMLQRVATLEIEGGFSRGVKRGEEKDAISSLYLMGNPSWGCFYLLQRPLASNSPFKIPNRSG